LSRQVNIDRFTYHRSIIGQAHHGTGSFVLNTFLGDLKGISEYLLSAYDEFKSIAGSGDEGPWLRALSIQMSSLLSKVSELIKV